MVDAKVCFQLIFHLLQAPQPFISQLRELGEGEHGETLHLRASRTAKGFLADNQHL